MLIASLVLAAAVAAPTDRVLAQYEEHEAKQLVPMLVEVIGFPTHQYDAEAHANQKAWLMKTAAELGFVARDAGKITEIELPGPANAPILGLVIHGDVQPADAEAWAFPPFVGRVQDGYVLGRGAADDKGPLIQTLLAMKALAESGVPRTHTIRLLVGSEEESSATEMAEYLKDHQPPDYSLVLDSEFPVVVGEKAWDGLAITTTLKARGAQKPFMVESIDAGLTASIVPDHAELRLLWEKGVPDWAKLIAELNAVKMLEGTRLIVSEDNDLLRVIAYGRSAHSGVNLTGGRNALVALARVMEGKLPAGGADDLFRFVRQAGQDLHGTGLGITDNDPLWGQYAVNIATVKRKSDDEPNQFVLFINLRRIPPRTGPQSREHLEAVVQKFNRKSGASLVVDRALSYFLDEPLAFNPNAKIVKRLMDVYTRATGEKAKPAISGGGTYAKRLPNAIAFGMWFPGKPYPGHDTNEKIEIEDLQRGAHVLIHALVDIATGEKIENAFAP
jgi:succinyl-diaminopimelate desuccinylase